MAQSAPSARTVKASPVARRLAAELGVELERLEGSGPRGRIVKSDVEAAAAGRPSEAAAAPPGTAATAQTADDPRGRVTVQTLSGLQRTVARRMGEAKSSAPEFVLETEVEMDGVDSLRQEFKELAGAGRAAPSVNDFVVKAAALALREFPRANGAYREGTFELYSRVNVGVAVAADDALVVPTVFEADRKSLAEIASDTRAIAERVRSGTVTPAELSSGTFTVSNLGMFGVERFTAVLNPPQAAILAVGASAPRCVARGGELTIRTMMRLSLTCDHRILYGADAARFLNRIRELLERPLELAL